MWKKTQVVKTKCDRDRKKAANLEFDLENAMAPNYEWMNMRNGVATIIINIAHSNIFLHIMQW